MGKISRSIGLVAALAILATGCAAESDPQEASQQPPAASSKHSGDHSAGHDHTPGMDMSAMNAGTGPSEAAKMVCKHVTRDAVNRLAAPDATLKPTSEWDGELFTCTYDLPIGPVVLTVHDATDPQVGQKYFDDLKASTEGAEKINGMASFGFPAFETEGGIVGFIKDGKTLEVDTTGLDTNEIGPEGYSRNLLAYELAATVIACWTE